MAKLRIWKPIRVANVSKNKSPWKCQCISCWGRRRAKAKSFHLIPQDYIWDLIHDCHKRDQSNWQESLSFFRSLQWCNCRLDSPFLLEWTPHTKEKSSDIKWEWDFMKIAEGAYWKMEGNLLAVELNRSKILAWIGVELEQPLLPLRNGKLETGFGCLKLHFG